MITAANASVTDEPDTTALLEPVGLPRVTRVVNPSAELSALPFVPTR